MRTDKERELVRNEILTWIQQSGLETVLSAPRKLWQTAADGWTAAR
jgi:hypothetical protein